jgi:hypothetical protein
MGLRYLQRASVEKCRTGRTRNFAAILCCASLRERSKRSQMRPRLTPRSLVPYRRSFSGANFGLDLARVSGPFFNSCRPLSTVRPCGRYIQTSNQRRRLPAWWSAWATDAGDAHDRRRLHRDQYSARLDLMVRGGDARATEVLTAPSQI